MLPLAVPAVPLPSVPRVASSAGAPAAYARRRPEETVLWQVVHQHWRTFRANVEDADGAGTLPRFVIKEVEDFLRCGILAHGFVRVRCGDCGHAKLVAFACKRRGFCPSCMGRRMADGAAHLVDSVFPRVPVRQWVLTVPHRLRLRLAYDPALATRVLRIFVGAVSMWLRKSARDLPRVHRFRGRLECGGVTVIQRFNSAADLNVHFHTLMLDGVYRVEAGRPVEFHRTPAPSDEDVAGVAARVFRQVTRLLGGGAADMDADGEGDAPDGSQALLAISGASVLGVAGTGPRRGCRAVRVRGADPREAFVLGPRCAEYGGFNLNANVGADGRDRAGLEAMCRYIARPPLSNERLQWLPDGRVLLKLKRAYSDGTTAMILEPHELIEKLVALVPRPRRHVWRYHGVLGPAFKRRAEIVPRPAPEPVSAQGPPAKPPNGPWPARHPWAWLLWRVFLIDVLRCDVCAGRMKIVGAVIKRAAVKKILEHLGLGGDAPEPRPARPPPGVDGVGGDYAE